MKRFILQSMVLGFGMVLGTGATFSMLYNKPGNRIVMKLERMMDQHLGGSKDGGSAVAEWAPEPGFKIEPHATGFDFPVRIVFAPEAPETPEAPFYYVAELGGSIRVVTKDGQVKAFAEGLLNFEREPLDELGLLGLTYDPVEHQFFASMTYWDEAAGVYRNKIDRLGCSDDGLTLTDRETILDMKNEATVASYQIQFVALGPDDSLYAGIGSGGKKSDAQRLHLFAGKVIRFERDGSATKSNPWYDAAAPDSPQSYIVAYGLRNPYDIAWDPRTMTAIVSDVGPGIDRIVRLEEGVNYCFELDENEMRANALYTWGPGDSYAPVGVTFLKDGVLGFDHAFDLCVGLYGRVHSPGENAGKRILRFDLGLNGRLESGANPIIQYTGSHFASVTDVECGPDGLYFADIYGESSAPHTHGGAVYRMVEDPDYVPESQDGSGLTGAAKGKFLFQDNRCYSCHKLDGFGGNEGPALDHVSGRLTERLNAAEYEAVLAELGQRPGEYFQNQKPLYEELLQLKNGERVTAWLKNHIRDPRFDNPQAKMPSHDLSDTDIDALIEFLLEQ
jgi:glucose/arabinose dehydrogenase